MVLNFIMCSFKLILTKADPQAWYCQSDSTFYNCHFKHWHEHWQQANVLWYRQNQANSLFDIFGGKMTWIYRQTSSQGNLVPRPVWGSPTASFLDRGDVLSNSGSSFGSWCSCHEAFQPLTSLSKRPERKKKRKPTFAYKACLPFFDIPILARSSYNCGWSHQTPQSS